MVLYQERCRLAVLKNVPASCLQFQSTAHAPGQPPRIREALHAALGEVRRLAPAGPTPAAAARTARVLQGDALRALAHGEAASLDAALALYREATAGAEDKGAEGAAEAATAAMRIALLCNERLLVSIVLSFSPLLDFGRTILPAYLGGAEVVYSSVWQT